MLKMSVEYMYCWETGPLLGPLGGSKRGGHKLGAPRGPHATAGEREKGGGGGWG